MLHGGDHEVPMEQIVLLTSWKNMVGRVSVLRDLILIQSFLDFFVHVMNHLFYCWVK